LDGELAAYRGGRLDFAALGFSARRRAAAGVQLVYVAFDRPAAQGRDLRRLPYREWRARLAAALAWHGSAVVQLVTATDDPEI
jgi:ATP-dependent DNA ligase